MARKCIITDEDQLRLGHIDLHKQLVGRTGTPKGGGFWLYDKESNTVYVWGKSSDYGPLTADMVSSAWLHGKDMHIVFTSKEEMLKLYPNDPEVQHSY